MDGRRQIGNEGEALAAAYLEQRGFKVIGVQHRTAYGELDLVCLDGEEAVFVEVKTRQTDEYGYPEESVTPAKLRHVVRAAQAYLREKRWEGRPWLIDVVAIQELSGHAPDIAHFPAIDVPFETW